MTHQKDKGTRLRRRWRSRLLTALSCGILVSLAVSLAVVGSAGAAAHRPKHGSAGAAAHRPTHRGVRDFKRVTVRNDTHHVLRLVRIDGGARLDRWPGIGATLRPGESHEWDIRSDDGDQTNRAFYDVVGPSGTRVGGFEAYMVLKKWEGWAFARTVRNDCSFTYDFSGNCTASSTLITVKEPPVPPTTRCHDVKEERLGPDVGPEYRFHAQCDEIADFTKVRGESNIDPSDVYVDWFTTAGRTYTTDWHGVLLNLPLPYRFDFHTAPTGAGVKIYGPGVQAAGEPTTLYATVPADIAGSATFTDHHSDGSTTVLGSADTVNGTAKLALAPGTLAGGEHRIVATITYPNGHAYDAATTITVQ